MGNFLEQWRPGNAQLICLGAASLVGPLLLVLLQQWLRGVLARRARRVRAWLQEGLLSLFLRRVIAHPPKAFLWTPVPEPPDYSKRSSWAAFPGGEGVSPEPLLEGAEAPAPEAERPCDVFFLYETVYRGKDHWNQPINHPGCLEQAMLSVATMASAFSSCCRIYAPLYRSASLGAWLLSRRDGEERPACELAYSDALRAFRCFLQATEESRPFVLASFSQGGEHLQRLLAEVVEPCKALRGRLVAAYLLGCDVPLDRFTRSWPHLRPSMSPVDGCCVVAWNTYSAAAAAREGQRRASGLGCARGPGNWYASGWEAAGRKPLLQTNPLTWCSGRSGLVSGQGLWLGSGLPEGPGFARALETLELCRDATSAGRSCTSLLRCRELAAAEPTEAWEMSCECLDHGLAIPRLPQGLRSIYRQLLPVQEGNYHVLDYELWYFQIRQNARERVEAYLQRHGLGASHRAAGA